MRLPVIFHELAEGELNEAAAFYARARPGLGEAFLAEVQYTVEALVNAPALRARGYTGDPVVQYTVEALVNAPLAGAAAADDVRRWIVRRFPYSVLYRVREDHIRVLAVAHQKRRPFYWRGRR